MVRYCESCRKVQGASGYLKQGFLFEEYLAHCGDEEYVRLLRERFGGVRRGVGKVGEKRGEGAGMTAGRKEREKAEKVREMQEENKKAFWRDLEGLQREGKRVLRGGAGAPAACNGERTESGPKGFLNRLRSRSDRDTGSTVGMTANEGRPGGVARSDQSSGKRRDGDGINVDEYDSAGTMRPGTASTVSSPSRFSSLSGHSTISSARPPRGFRWAPT